MSTQNDDDLDFLDEGLDDETTEVTEQIDGQAEQADDQADDQAEQTDGQAEQADDPFSEPAPTVQSDEEKAAAAAAVQEAAAKQAKLDQEAFNNALEAFKAAVEATLTHEGRDVTTGVLPEVATSSVKEAYAALPGAKGKAAGKQYLIDQMQAAMVDGAEDPSNYVKARTYMNLQNDVKDTKSTGGGIAKTKVDPTEAHVQRIAALMIAANLVTVPADVEEGWENKAQKLAASLEQDILKFKTWQDNTADDKGDAPEVSPVVLTAAKLASGRALPGRKPGSTGGGSSRPSTAGSGHRGDIGQHIKEVFEEKADGDFLAISEIARTATSQYGRDGAPYPSQGAIAARLFPKSGQCNLDFVRPEGKDEGRPVKGAVKIA